MNRFSQIIFIVLAMMYLVPAQAMVSIDTGVSVCQVFAEDDTKESEKEKEDGKKKDGKKAGEEPECD